MRMAKSIANERISYKVIPQSLPKIKFWQNQLSSGAAAIESGTSKNQYSMNLPFLYSKIINNKSLCSIKLLCFLPGEAVLGILKGQNESGRESV